VYHTTCGVKKGFVIFTIVSLARIATVDMVLWDDTRTVPVTATWNNRVCYKGWEFT